MTFRANASEAQADRRGGVLRLTGAINRSIAYTTNARLTRNEAAALRPASHMINLVCDAADGGQAILINITSSLSLNRSVPDPDSALTAAARRWHKWFAAAPAVADDYRPHYDYAWWVMAAGLVAPRDYVTREALMPSKIKYIGIWQWDAYFHSLAYRHVDMRLAKDQIRIMLDHQRADGMIPDAIHDEGVITRLPHPVDGDVTKPPLLAWAAWELHEQDGDREFWTPYPVATTARNHPKYDLQTMWRGPVWMNVNYLLIEGLQRSGHLDVARELRSRTLAMIMGEDEIYEYYNPETGKHLPEAASAFGWSAALFIDLAIQASREAMQ
jgi:hypothetical protein